MSVALFLSSLFSWLHPPPACNSRVPAACRGEEMQDCAVEDGAGAGHVGAPQRQAPVFLERGDDVATAWRGERRRPHRQGPRSGSAAERSCDARRGRDPRWTGRDSSTRRGRDPRRVGRSCDAQWEWRSYSTRRVGRSYGATGIHDKGRGRRETPRQRWELTQSGDGRCQERERERRAGGVGKKR